MKFVFDVFDGVVPEDGAVLVGPRSRHLVLSRRPIDSRLWHDRWSLEVRRLGKDEPVPAGARVMEIRTHAKGECSHCIAREAGLPVPDFVVCSA